MTSHADAGAPALILIVDDEPDNRDLFEIVLRHEGFRVATADSGPQALAMLSRERPDLILLDVMMPDMDGYEVVTAIKARPATSTIPILMISALSNLTCRNRALEVGAQDFLHKPVERALLYLSVRRLLACGAATN